MCVFLRRVLALVVCLSVLFSITAPVLAIEESAEEKKKAIDSVWRNDNYVLLNMCNESWFETMLIASDLWDMVSDPGNWSPSGTAKAYESAMVELVYPSNESAKELFEKVSGGLDNISIAKDIYFEIKEIDSSVILDNIVYLGKGCWTLAKIANGSNYLCKALGCVKKNGHGDVQQAAKSLLKKRELIRNGNAGTVALREVFSEASGQYVAWSIVDGALPLWKHLVQIETKAADKYLGTGTVASTIKRYHTLAYIQAEIENTMNFTKRVNYTSDEEYLEDYRALAYAYVMCALQANALFASWDGIDKNQWAQVKEIMNEDLARLMAVPIREDDVIIGTEESKPGSGEVSASAQTGNSQMVLKNYSYPCMLQHQDTFVCYGTVERCDGGSLGSVSVQVLDSGGNAVIDVSSGGLSGRSSFEILELDSSIAIDSLIPGTYQYRVLADGQELLREPFNVLVEDHAFTITGYRLPKPMAQGSTFPVTGTVRSEKTMVSISVGIYDANGSWITGDDDAPRAQTYDLSNLDYNTRFDYLSAGGQYRYRISATDCDDRTETLVDQPFYVY